MSQKKDAIHPTAEAIAEGNEKAVPFAVVESYKKIRTNLQFLLMPTARKIVSISSPIQAEGKSTTTVNTAIAFSQLGSKVLLIDADLRKPTIYKKMRISNSKGLSSVLVGFSTFEESVNHINPYLDVLVSGPTPPNPSELLGSDNMSRLLDALETQYDYIFIDTPPINIVSDALVLAPKTSGILLVIKSGSTTHEQFKKALSSIEFTGAHLLGAVLNGSKEVVKKGQGKYGYAYE